MQAKSEQAPSLKAASLAFNSFTQAAQGLGKYPTTPQHRQQHQVLSQKSASITSTSTQQGNFNKNNVTFCHSSNELRSCIDAKQMEEVKMPAIQPTESPTELKIDEYEEIETREVAPTAMFQPIYRRPAKPNYLQNLK